MFDIFGWRQSFLGGGIVVPVCPRVCICLGFKGAAFPCVSLLWGSWGPACSRVQHRDSDTSCIHRRRPLPNLWCPLCCPASDHRDTTDPPTISSEKKKGKKDRNNSLLLTCFYYLTGEEKLFDIRGQKTSCSGLGTLGCLTDWLHGQSSQGLSLCPTAFQTAPGLREFCLGQKNDKLELHFTKSECLGFGLERCKEWNEIAFYHVESKHNGSDVNVFVVWTNNHMNMQNKRRGFPLLRWSNW